MEDQNSIQASHSHYFKLKTEQVFGVLGIFVIGFILSGIVQFGAVYFFGYKNFMTYFFAPTWLIPFVFTIISSYLIFLKPKNQQYNFGFTISQPLYMYPVFIFMFGGAILLNEWVVSLIPTTDSFGILDAFYKVILELEKSIKEYPISATLTAVILAPIFEEILFRGIILKGMLNNGTKPIKAILISAFIFGVIHFNPWQFVGAFILGALLGFVYYKTQSILNVILLHFLNNGISAFLLFYSDQTDISQVLNLSEYGSVFFGILLFSIFGTLFYIITKNKKWKFY